MPPVLVSRRAPVARRPCGWRCALAACLAVACGRAHGLSDNDLGGLVVAETHTAPIIALDRASTDPDELGRTLQISHHDLVAVLGMHTVAITMTTRITERGNVVSNLEEKTAIERGENGAFHAVYTNSEDYGREATFVDGKLYLRPRYQRWHAREPAPPSEPIALADQFYDPIAATWDLVSPAIALTNKGSAHVAGRNGRAISISRAASPRHPRAEPLAQRKWREQRTVEAVTGDVVLDEQRSVPLTVNLTGTVQFQRDGRTFAMQISLQSSVADIGKATPIAAPAAAEVVATPERLREVDDRDFLLQGIAPPLHRPRNGSPDKPSPAAQGGTSP